MFASLFKESVSSIPRGLSNAGHGKIALVFYCLLLLLIWISIFPWWLSLFFCFISLDISVVVLLLGFIAQLAYVSF